MSGSVCWSLHGIADIVLYIVSRLYAHLLDCRVRLTWLGLVMGFREIITRLVEYFSPASALGPLRVGLEATHDI